MKRWTCKNRKKKKNANLLQTRDRPLKNKFSSEEKCAADIQGNFTDTGFYWMRVTFFSSMVMDKLSRIAKITHEWCPWKLLRRAALLSDGLIKGLWLNSQNINVCFIPLWFAHGCHEADCTRRDCSTGTSNPVSAPSVFFKDCCCFPHWSEL